VFPKGEVVPGEFPWELTRLYWFWSIEGVLELKFPEYEFKEFL
jgi:hypothetical protein